MVIRNCLSLLKDLEEIESKIEIVEYSLRAQGLDHEIDQWLEYIFKNYISS